MNKVKRRDKEQKGLDIGFISTRFSGLDGVSLETLKWEKILTEFNHRCYWFAGELDRDTERCMLVPEAFFQHPHNVELNKALFGAHIRSRAITDSIHRRKEFLKDKIYRFIEQFNIDLLVAENVLSIPMHIPLGIALTEIIAETGIPTIGHHHDFSWERPRFLHNAIQDIIDMAFPPELPSVRHVVINTVAQTELAAKRGISSIVVYNVIDFDRGASRLDGFKRNFRRDLGFSDKDILILQPTRVVSRKGIDQSLQLVNRLQLPNLHFLISHSVGDEGPEYFNWIKEVAQQLGISITFLHNRLHKSREYMEIGKKWYSLWDVYPHADLITYPSLYEGFGNAFLEAVYFKKPLLMNRYSVYIVDIEPKGFDAIAIDGFLTQSAVQKVREVLLDREIYNNMVEKNFEIGKKYFSYNVLRKKLSAIFTSFYGSLNGTNGNGKHNGTK